MQDAQLNVREDIMGNIFGRWEGLEKAAGSCYGLRQIPAMMQAGGLE